MSEHEPLLLVRELLEELNRLIKEDERVLDAFVDPYIKGVEVGFYDGHLPVWVRLVHLHAIGEEVEE